jgi:hypothetical protein
VDREPILPISGLPVLIPRSAAQPFTPGPRPLPRAVPHTARFRSRLRTRATPSAPLARTTTNARAPSPHARRKNEQPARPRANTRPLSPPTRSPGKHAARPGLCSSAHARAPRPLLRASTAEPLLLAPPARESVN